MRHRRAVRGIVMPPAFAILLLLCVLQGGAVSHEPYTWWITHPLATVRPRDTPPKDAAKDAALFAARNEFEPFQLVLRAEGSDLNGVDIEVAGLRSADGAAIPRANIAVYLEPFVVLDRASSIEGDSGEWPDPLIPRVDRYTGERRNAFPFAVARGRSQPVWIEIFVPPDAPPGEYTGSATVSFNGRSQFTAPVRLTVWAFALPSTASLRSSFGLSGIAALKQHRGRYTNEEDLAAITRMYAKAALLHRVSIHGGTMAPPKYSDDAGKVRVDWRAYEEELAPFLDGTVIPRGEPLAGAKSTSAELRAPSSFPNTEQQRLYWKEWIAHFEQKGWLDRLFLYLWDEPPLTAYPEVLKRGRAAALADPKIRSLVTVPFTRQLEEVVRVWVPLVNCLDPKPDAADFCHDTPRLDVYAGKDLWFYQSCASHGCNIVGGSYFTGWPSYMIDMPGAANRVMQWIAWKYGIAGELYYSMNENYSRDRDPWSNLRLSGGNGDGTLFYPGVPSRIGGRGDIPIESIRLKLIREGMEDYEYLALLAARDGREAAGEFAARIVQQAYRWEARPEPFLEVRRALGERLSRSGR
jgi:hypothetical protein